MDFKDRLKEVRTRKNLSQGKLAELTGVNVMNISRYERGEHKPNTDILTKLANVLDVTTDFLMSGTIDEAAQNIISDKELLTQFQDISKLPNERKVIIKEVIDSFLFKSRIQQQLIRP
jgi:transcriptional regulator with XRE-family HTH domain